MLTIKVKKEENNIQRFNILFEIICNKKKKYCVE